MPAGRERFQGMFEKAVFSLEGIWGRHSAQLVWFTSSLWGTNRVIIKDDLVIILNWGADSYSFYLNTGNKLNENEWRFIIKKILPLSLWQFEKEKKQQNIAVSSFFQICLFCLAFFLVTFKYFETGFSLPAPFAFLGYFLETVFFPTLMLINTWQGTILCSVH